MFRSTTVYSTSGRSYIGWKLTAFAKMKYPNHWIKYSTIRWDLPNPKFSQNDIFEYSYRDQFALTPLTPDNSLFSFDVRCRYRIFDLNKIEIFGSLVEVSFVINDWDLNRNILDEYADEARDVYEHVYDQNKAGSTLDILQIYFSDRVLNKDPLDQIFEPYKNT